MTLIPSDQMSPDVHCCSSPPASSSSTPVSHTNCHTVDHAGWSSQSGLDIIKAALLWNSSSGTHASVFSNDISILQNSLHLHSISCDNLTWFQCQQVLVSHLLTGACVNYDCDVSTSSCPDHSTYRNIAAGFKSSHGCRLVAMKKKKTVVGTATCQHDGFISYT